MLTNRKNFQIKMHSVTIDDLVPKEHFLRKVDAIIDSSFIYDNVRGRYCENNGRPSTDPVSLTDSTT